MKKLFSVFLGAIVAISLVGCSNNNSKVSIDKENLTGVHKTGTPVYGGEITVAVENELDSLDPYMAVAAGTKELLYNIYEGLVKFTPEGDIMPAIAESYEVSDDLKAYTFHIREGIMFHDYTLVGYEDIIYSINKAVENKSSVAFENINFISGNGQNSITINLIEPDNDFLPYLTASFVSVIPNNYENSKEVPIGTGPFKFSSYVVQQELVVEKFEEYWDAENVYLDKINFKLFADANSAFLELLSGAVDLYPSVGIEHYDQLKKDYNISLSYKNIVQLLAFNNDVEPFNNIKVRQAINYVINKNEIIELQSSGYATKIGSPLLPGFKKYYNEELVDYYDVDLKKAEALLNEAGYEDGFEFTIKIPSNYQFHVSTGEIIALQLEQIGITANIQLVEWGSWLEDVYNGRNYDSTIIGLTGELSPRDWLSRYETTSPVNFMNFSSEDFDLKYKEALSIVDDNESVEAYKGLQEIVTSNAPAVFIQDTQFLTVSKKNIGGYVAYPVYIQDMSKVYYMED